MMVRGGCLMRMHIQINTISTVFLAVLLAFACCDAALAKPRKLKTPSSEMGIKRNIDGAPTIRLDHRARLMAKPSRKRPTGQ
jgi:hypothetical protein